MDTLTAVIASPFLPHGPERQRLAESIAESLLTDMEYQRAYRYVREHGCGLDVMTRVLDERVRKAVNLAEP